MSGKQQPEKPDHVEYAPSGRRRSIRGQEIHYLSTMGVVELGKQVRPITREDLLKLIEENGGTAEYLRLTRMDMSGVDLRGMCLDKTDLSGCNLENALAMPMVTLDTGDLPVGDLAYELALRQWEEGNKEAFVQSVTPVSLKGAFLSYSNMSKADFRWVDFTDALLIGANLQSTAMYRCNLSGAYLRWARMEETVLWKANLTNSYLENSIIGGADLRDAILTSPRLVGARIDTPLLSGITWPENYCLPEELEGLYSDASQAYTMLKQACDRAGESDTAGQFHYREWECKRKLAEREGNWFEIGEFWLYRLLAGYGERPKRVIMSGAVVILLFAFLYFPFTWAFCWTGGCWALLWEGVWKALYFSGVSFTALGYGDWVSQNEIAPPGWTRFLGVIESLFGVSLIALFLVTFTRKMTR